MDIKKMLTPNTKFEIGSISKPFAALGVLQLASQNIFDINTNVETYLTSWHIPANQYTEDDPVTLRMLMAHIAGTNVYGFPGIDQSVQPLPSIVDVLNGKKPYVVTDPVQVVSKPGSTLSYSGGGYSILQLAIQDTTGQDFATWMDEHVLRNMGMENSTYQQPLPKEYEPLASSAHDTQGIPYAGNYHNYPELAAAGLWSTAPNLAHALMILMNGYYGNSLIPGLNAEYTKQLFIQQQPSLFGLGLVIDNRQSVLTFGHSGGDDGFISNMVAYVDNNSISSIHNSQQLKDGLIVLTNSDNGSDVMGQLYNSFTDTYKINYGQAKTFEEVDNPKPLPNYVTNFSVPGDDRHICYNIILNQDDIRTLKVHFDGWAVDQVLYPVGNNQFMDRMGNKFIYTWDDSGKLNLGLQYPDNPIQPVIVGCNSSH
jgi:CubicO group peptidase (beta-lactamase class C family)